ncbi:MAG: hypothetical protein K2K70_08580 [Lachnospiraceae bacterium]|nr:hypothetical protein [Lachnospiraceae bacterium]
MKEKIINNKFVDKLLQFMEIDEEEYLLLCDALICLAEEWKDVEYIDKELVSYLYAIPLMVRNEFISLEKVCPDAVECDRLEDIWVELDALVSNCFSN